MTVTYLPTKAGAGAIILCLSGDTKPVVGQTYETLVETDTGLDFHWNGAAWVVTPTGGGTVTTVSVTTANGVSGSVANPTTTPAITLTLGAITPSSVAASGNVTGANLGNITPVNLDGNGTHVLLGNGTFGTVPGGSGAWAALGNTTTSGNATSVTFSSISSSYNTLAIIGMGRSSTSAGTATVFMQFNGDTGSNYNSQLAGGSNASAVIAATGGTSFRAGDFAGASATANYAGNLELKIPGYTLTTFFKNWSGVSYVAATNGAGGSVMESNGGQWGNTTAVNAIKLFPPGADHFVDGTTFWLYGIL